MEKEEKEEKKEKEEKDEKEDNENKEEKEEKEKKEEKEEKEEKGEKKFLWTDGWVDKTKEVQEVLADLKSGNELDWQFAPEKEMYGKI